MNTLDLVWEVLRPTIPPLLLGVGWFIVAELKQHGYQTTYATALLRAVGAGFVAAQAQGVDPFSDFGRKIVVHAGVSYMNEVVPNAALALGLGDEDHELRVSAQLGVLAAESRAAAVQAGMTQTHAMIAAMKAQPTGDVTWHA